MDIVEKLAKRSYRDNIEFSRGNNRDSVNNIKLLVYDLDSKLDKIKFLNFHIDWVNEEYQKHLKTCSNPNSCQINEDAETLIFYLQQELKSLGVELNGDTFTNEEKIDTNYQLQEILEKLEDVKLGNQIIYDDLLKEFEELKSLYFLGKKKWHQLLTGKVVEMTVGGVISETVSKDLISLIKPSLNNLLK
ncbi:hypothetical protein [Flavobacterium pectinovorum]|uniref:Uncharacterized protein n=1 Tax=Flavobacterium pectinovorum TaxID=29533 RepID=A0AB36NUX0_9FLAO|nr:hypothetical protein [Flavobacterium pectinovorum]OXA99471.1 hypothetical protein B0A72_21740 [Flavobacterium pectinovorum]SHN07496.1 hypothetical protein SAMN05444387_3976 [Flavobacterium pectinovorum]